MAFPLAVVVAGWMYWRRSATKTDETETNTFPLRIGGPPSNHTGPRSINDALGGSFNSRGEPNLSGGSVRAALKRQRSSRYAPDIHLGAESKIDYDEERLIDTDAGEECDDEFTLLEECCYAADRPNIMLRVMFTDKKGVDEIRKFIYLCGGKDFSALPNIEFFTPEQLSAIRRTNARKYSLLQIGPNRTAGLQTKLLAYYEGVQYKYVLLGMPGTTNAKAHFKDLWNRAHSRYIVDTANGTGAFKFRMSDIASRMSSIGNIFGNYIQWAICLERLKQHVARIGFRNLCGRAFPYVILYKQGKPFKLGVAKHISHLVAADKRGANFQTAFGVAQKIYPELVDGDIEQSVIRMRDFKIEFNDKINAVVTEYVNLMKNNGLEFQGGYSNGPKVQVTEDQIKDGYAFILKVCWLSFGVPIEFYVSGSPNNWEDQWFDGKFKTLKDGVYERTDSRLDDRMDAAFKNWYRLIHEKGIETSPAYDVVGGRFSRGGFGTFFSKENYSNGKLGMVQGFKVTMKKGRFSL